MFFFVGLLWHRPWGPYFKEASVSEGYIALMEELDLKRLLWDIRFDFGGLWYALIGVHLGGRLRLEGKCVALLSDD